MSLLVLIAAIVVTAVVVFQFACQAGMFGPRVREVATRHTHFRTNIVVAVVLWALWVYLGVVRSAM